MGEVLWLKMETGDGLLLLGVWRASLPARTRQTIFYSCEHTHDLYLNLGTRLGYGNGSFQITLDGVPPADRTPLEGAFPEDAI